MTFEPNVELKGKSVVKVKCGGAHTILFTSSNELFSFGLNDKGQLGLGIVGGCFSIPTKV